MTNATRDPSNLTDFIKTLIPEQSDGTAEDEDELRTHYLSRDKWRIWTNPPWNDFTRQILPPGGTLNGKNGSKTAYPDGALLIWGDFNFWILAILPLRFAEIPFPEVVQAIWPEIEEPELYPDNDHPFWDAICDRDTEVPGYPFELWVKHNLDHDTVEFERLDFLKTEQELKKELQARHEPGPKFVDDPNVSYFGRLWDQGKRIQL